MNDPRSVPRLFATLVGLTMIVAVAGCGARVRESMASNATSTFSVERVVERLDPLLDEVISSDARLEMLKDDYFGLSEGPVWVPAETGYLLFSDIGANSIYKFDPDTRTLSTYLERSGYTGSEPAGPRGFARSNGRLFVSLIGSNGITRDRQGRLVVCASGDRSVVRIELDGSRTTLADTFEGKRLNRPNDIVVRSDGAVYFTDPRPAEDLDLELSYSGVYVLKDGKLRLLERDLRVPNGLTFSPDEKYLYLASSADRQVMRYDVEPDGSLVNRRVFVDMSKQKEAGAPDGMKVDQKGNLYSTGPGGVWIMSPDGKHLGTIRLGANNVAFGDADAKTLYITARRGLARIRLKAPGIRP